MKEILFISVIYISYCYFYETFISNGPELGLPDSLGESEKLLLKRAVKEKDIDLLSSLVNNRYNKNPKVDFQAEETLLHYLAQRSNNAFLFESIAEKVDNWFCSNRNGDTPIDIAASKGHGNIIESLLKLKRDEDTTPKIIRYVMGVDLKDPPVCGYDFNEKEEFLCSDFFKKMKAMLLAGENGHSKSIFKIFAWIDNRIKKNLSGPISVENRMKLQEFVIGNPVIKKHFKKQFKNFKLLSNGLYDWMDKQHMEL